jgi:hypothetical protein
LKPSWRVVARVGYLAEEAVVVVVVMLLMPSESNTPSFKISPATEVQSNALGEPGSTAGAACNVGPMSGGNYHLEGFLIDKRHRPGRGRIYITGIANQRNIPSLALSDIAASHSVAEQACNVH